MNSELQRLLQLSLSGDLASLKEATSKLAEIEKQAGYGPGLFAFLDDTNAENLQLLAAINLKNYIKKYWHEHELFYVPPPDRVFIRDHLVARMLHSRSRKLQEQLCECIILVASKDFPDDWPNMLNQMLGELDLKDLNSVLGVFQSLDGIFYKYRHEFRCESLWAEIELVLTNFSGLYFEVTKTICQQLSYIAGLPVDQQRTLIEILYYCTRIFVSLISQELATHFEENLSTYMECFMLVLNFQTPSTVDKVTSEFLIESKVSVCEALSLLMHVYSSDFMPFAFEFMKTVWTMLISLDCNKTELDTLKCAAMQFLAKAVAADELAKVMSESSALQAVCEQVIIPNITIREQDFESYEDNPDEFIRKDIENTDTDTPRRAAYDFIRALCLKLESQVVAVFGQYIESLLQAYAQNASDNWRQKDVATFLAICLAKKSHTAKHGATATSQFIDLNRFYVEALQPHLAEEDVNNLPILKADAMKFLTEFRYCLPRELLLANMPHLIRIVGCDLYTVSVYASYAIERMLSMQLDNGPYFTSNELRPLYSTMLTNVLKALVNKTNNCENDYAMKATLRLVCRTDLLEDLSAKLILESVVGVLKAAAANPKKPLFNHYGFETIGYLLTWYSSKGDSGAATIQNVYSGVNLFLEEIYNKDISDFVPYALQIWSIMVPKADSSLIESIVRKAMDIDRLCENGSYVPPLIKLISALVFFQNKLIFPSEMPKILTLVRKTIASRVRDRDGFELINAMTLHCDKVYFQPFLRDIYVLLFERLTAAKTPRFVQDFIRFNSLVIIQYGAAFTIDLFGSLQANLFHMVCKRLYLGELKKVRSNEKTVIIGTTKLIVEPKFVNNYSDLWINMVKCLIQFIKCEPSPQEASSSTVVAEASDSLEQLLQESDLSHNQLKSCPPLSIDPVPTAQSGTEFFRVEMSSFLSGAHKDLSADLLIQAKQIIASA